MQLSIVLRRMKKPWTFQGKMGLQKYADQWPFVRYSKHCVCCVPTETLYTWFYEYWSGKSVKTWKYSNNFLRQAVLFSNTAKSFISNNAFYAGKISFIILRQTDYATLPTYSAVKNNINEQFPGEKGVKLYFISLTLIPAFLYSCEASSGSKGDGIGTTGRSFVLIPRCWRDICECNEFLDLATVPQSTHL